MENILDRFSEFYAQFTQQPKKEVASIKIAQPKPVAKKEDIMDGFNSFHKLNIAQGIDYSKATTGQDVSKMMLGRDDFLALTSVAEGFRGDLHLDPATGLNIGMGYNITARARDYGLDGMKQQLISRGIDSEEAKDSILSANGNKEKLTRNMSKLGFDQKEIKEIMTAGQEVGDKKIQTELRQIGIKTNVADELIEISKLPQNKITKGIKEFNKEYGYNEKNPLINIEQAAYLVKLVQPEYYDKAKRIFSNSFDEMNEHQQAAIAYSGYKANLGGYKRAIKLAEHAADGKGKWMAVENQLNFNYKIGGQGDWIRDTRAEDIIKGMFNSPKKFAHNVHGNEGVRVLAQNEAKDEQYQKIALAAVPTKIVVDNALGGRTDNEQRNNQKISMSH